LFDKGVLPFKEKRKRKKCGLLATITEVAALEAGLGEARYGRHIMADVDINCVLMPSAGRKRHGCGRRCRRREAARSKGGRNKAKAQGLARGPLEDFL
jgi:hypothetical protein